MSGKQPQQKQTKNNKDNVANDAHDHNPLANDHCLLRECLSAEAEWPQKNPSPLAWLLPDQAPS